MNRMQWMYTVASVLIPLVLYAGMLTQRLFAKRRLNPDSVKYTIDHLPMGILFYREDGLTLLVNEAMQSLSGQLMRQKIVNGKEFHEFLLSHPADARFTVSGDEDEFTLAADGATWSFRRSTVSAGKERVFQLIAYDTTELYEREVALYNQIRELNETQENLKHYQEQTDTLAANEAFLATKERIHDSLGQVLLATRYYLTDPEASITEEELATSWRTTLDELTHAAGGEQTTVVSATFVKPLEAAAKALGARLFITGTLPAQDVRLNRLIVSCARVCIINAVRHGAADEITIAFDEVPETGYCRFRISNNGRPADDRFTEGGGLKSMRANVEKEGGTVTYETSPRFTADIRVPAGRWEEQGR